MFDDDHFGFDLARFGLSSDQGFKRFRCDEVGSNAALFQFNAVVETPR